jgi:hypothetical protein
VVNVDGFRIIAKIKECDETIIIMSICEYQSLVSTTIIYVVILAYRKYKLSTHKYIISKHPVKKEGQSSLDFINPGRTVLPEVFPAPMEIRKKANPFDKNSGLKNKKPPGWGWFFGDQQKKPLVRVAFSLLKTIDCLKAS